MPSGKNKNCKLNNKVSVFINYFMFAFFLFFLSQQAFGGNSGSQLLQPQTDAILPPHKKKVPPDTSVKERLFILFHPHPLPVNVLEDVFW